MELIQTSKVFSFIAMEYYNLILNRTLVVFSDHLHLYAFKVNGYIRYEGHAQLKGIREEGNWDDPLTYTKESFMELVDIINPTQVKIASPNWEGWQFVIPKHAIYSIKHIKQKKWGMGGIPHNGRLYVSIDGFKNREFILLGKQDANYIIEHL